MSCKCAEVRELRLRPAADADTYALHRAALEWSLAEPIIIERAEDIRSRPQWQDRVEPFEHQVQNLFTFCRRLPVLLLADDVGLGKTISAGLILSELMKRRRVSRTLVICPKILTSQWEEELDTKFGVPSKIITGAYQKLDDHRAVPVVITTYQSALRRLERIARDAFDLVILDEAHKLRNLFGTPKPPQMALRIREALEQRLFKYVLLLTATPIHNRLWDAYSLVDLLAVARGHKNPFGDATEFRNRFIARGTDGRQLVPGRAPEFRGILRQYLVRTRRSDAKLEFPGAQSGHVARNPHG